MDNNTENMVTTEVTETKVKKKKKGKIVLLIVLFTILALLLGVVGYAVYAVKFHTPDTGTDDPPPFATDDLFETEDTTSPPETGTGTGTGTDTDTDTDTTPEETQRPEPPKEKQNVYNFLVVGQDRVALNTDVIMLINLNATTHKINVLQIPRDTYIELSTYSGKINGLYAHYFVRNGRNKKVALRMFADTLEQNLCIKIHNVLHINLDGVQQIVTALGGVDVNVVSPITLHYTDGTPVFLDIGLHHLDGYLAEQFIRHRSSYIQADIGRMDAQKIFMSAVIKKVQQNFNVSTIADLAEIVFKNTTTDINLTDGIFYAKELLNIKLEYINFMSMVGKGSMSNEDGTGLSLYIMVRKNMREMINSYFNIYDFTITDSIFDRNRVFTSTEKYPHINQHYINENVNTKDPFSADDINDSSIKIPHK
ncbi:MAG: LCP family protein [Clostridia bacterium]|nr:LCP family protein [Clostridia bacterium]